LEGARRGILRELHLDGEQRRTQCARRRSWAAAREPARGRASDVHPRQRGAGTQLYPADRNPGRNRRSGGPVSHHQHCSPFEHPENRDAPSHRRVAGAGGNVVASAIIQIDPIYASHYLSLGTATIAATNTAPFTGGDLLADDETYRAQLLRLPRTLFTVQALSATVLNLDGVRDCRVSDPLGGVDVSLSLFSSFVFDRRRFGQARFLGTPYFFDVLVAPRPGYAWETIGAVIGLRDQVAAAVDTVRPIGIFPNIRLADLVVVGVRANITTQPGMDLVAVGAALKSAFEQRVAGLGLGGAVLASEVLGDLLNVSGVVDVQNLHLRRNPPTFGSIVFGDREQFQGAAIEADLGANLSLTSNEIATFQYNSQLIDLRVSDR